MAAAIENRLWSMGSVIASIDAWSAISAAKHWVGYMSQFQKDFIWMTAVLFGPLLVGSVILAMLLTCFALVGRPH